MQAAPLFTDITDGPDGGAAHWLKTSDGVQIRVGLWNMKAAKGTVLIFPGRTEFVEKYGDTARELQQRGYASLAVDWRGQGIADRLMPNRAIGHVGRFLDYQKDVAAVVDFAAAKDLPRPFFLLAHSMGGCIGLRSLMDGLDVNAVMFSAPMWGVHMPAHMRPIAWALSTLGLAFGFDQKMAPGQSEQGYVLREDFADNTLTNDPEVWAMLRGQLQTQPDLSLGGPSYRWLNTALREMRKLSRMPSPNIPALTYLGTQETIVDPRRVHARMDIWPNGTLKIIEDGKHEMLMGTPDMRLPIMDQTATFFDTHRG